MGIASTRTRGGVNRGRLPTRVIAPGKRGQESTAAGCRRCRTDTIIPPGSCGNPSILGCNANRVDCGR
eukprot:8881010-Lingulodinium_polyedra.AAC.1